ncbi:BspA family leucine-rich repeat surface protein [Bathymodiolus thermophilus thioautotrophic gill symbiont]|uniref:Uncharacterized protein n=1 Tax=Bathymodiolus thermophilus thioautotrophic gill symbiont TaxID=2360 RepID=A0A8H9CGI7_9GAMM|nr:BspA family leucine-rich repeat surface protein [Bathymodiolus thermophilus thioautotrophic gill symbiont]CAB5503156.1 hypothetical protein THERMOS_1740 [Bathymodiolus thermophilus thioautotrophic gill symbiont]
MINTIKHTLIPVNYLTAQENNNNKIIANGHNFFSSTTTTTVNTTSDNLFTTEFNVKQWAIAASASSEYSATRYSVEQVIGVPDTGLVTGKDQQEIDKAWAEAKSKINESNTLTLTYSEPVYIKDIIARETWNPGAISKVEVMKDGIFVTVYTKTDAGETGGTMSGVQVGKVSDTKISLTHALDYLSNKIRLTIGNNANEYNEIDAVQLISASVFFNVTVLSSADVLNKIYEDSGYVGNTPDDDKTTVEQLSMVAKGVNYYLEDRYQAAIEAKTDFTNPTDSAAQAIMTDEVATLVTEQSANLSFLYFGHTSFNDDISNMDTSLATNMSYMFCYDETITRGVCYNEGFNQDIGNWDVGNVTNMNRMFYGANVFNQDIGNWDVSKVVNMKEMFCYATSFNQDIGNWDVSKVVNMSHMFIDTLFNQNISNWDVGRVTDTSSMFSSTPFNQNISNWDVGEVVNMEDMFSGAIAFNQNIGNWNVSNVINMIGMFDYTEAFNQDISSWDVGNVTNMRWMFFDASAFNQDIGNWNVSKVTDMGYMFASTIVFNQDIGNWNVNKVTDMGYMFSYTDSFNQDIGNWNVSKVTNMGEMFYYAKAFNQDIGNWNIKNLEVANNILDKTAFSTENYDLLLAGWSDVNVTDNEGIKTGVSFGANDTKYTNATARQALLDKNWTIADNGLLNDSNNNGIKDVFVGNNAKNTIDKSGHGEAITLHGLGDNDTLTGSNHADTLYGGAGDDTLTGNAGADTFVYSYQNAGHDTIKDFNASEGDKINLSYLMDGYQEDKVLSDYLTLLSNSKSQAVLHISANGNVNGSNDEATREGSVTITLENIAYSEGLLNNLVDNSHIVLI